MIFLWILLFCVYAEAQSVTLEDAQKSYVAGNWKTAAGQFDSVCPTLEKNEQTECALWGILALSQTGDSQDFKQAKNRLETLIHNTSPNTSVYSDLYMTKSQFELYLKQPEKAIQSWVTAFETAAERQYPVLEKVCESIYKQHPKPEIKETCERLRQGDSLSKPFSTASTEQNFSSSTLSSSSLFPSSSALLSSSEALPEFQNTDSSSLEIQTSVKTTWVLQLGAFGQETNAGNLSQSLQKHDIPTQITSKRSGEKTLFLLQTKPFPTREEALLYGEQKLKPIQIDFHPVETTREK